MAFLGTGLFLTNSLKAPSGSNIAPSIGMVALNFDLFSNSAPVGQSQTMSFIVPAGNAAPVGQALAMTFEVPAANAPPVGQNLAMSFTVPAPNAAPIAAPMTLNFDLISEE